ncbi:MAG: hypothetical protein ABR975_12155, partial [Vulcanimicrobiaceae bacterium]
MYVRSLGTLVLAIAALAGCGGRGTLAGTPATGSGGRVATATARFTITVPPKSTTAGKRRGAYVSSATQSMVVTLVSANGSPYTGSAAITAVNLTPASPQCSTTTPVTCTVTVPAVPGSDVYTLVAYDATQSSSSPSTPAGNALSRTTTTVSVVEGATNTFPVTLAGVVDSITLVPTSTALTNGTSTTIPASVNAYDADGALIAGPGGYTDAAGDTLTLALTSSDVAVAFSSPAITTAGAGTTLEYAGAPTASSTVTVGVTVQGGSIAGSITGATLTVSSSASAYTVTSSADSGVGTLRAAITSANTGGGSIVFSCGTPCTINLASPLPPIEADMRIDGGTFGNVVINGGLAYEPFFVDTGAVVFANLQIQNAVAHGGNGGAAYAPGGGGLGAGGAIFVNQAGANVGVENVYFVNCEAIGGNGGTSAPSAYDFGGGGGLFYAGGAGNNTDETGGGGGGVLGAGAAGGSSGGAGGSGDGGGGSPSGAAGATFTTNAAGAHAASAFAAGNGGFGGGGGGSDNTGGSGGFGGGGGGFGGNGGPGGGGGGSADPGTDGLGGTLVAPVAGGASHNFMAGGGGAAAGPAVFVYRGTLTTSG